MRVLECEQLLGAVDGGTPRDDDLDLGAGGDSEWSLTQGHLGLGSTWSPSARWALGWERASARPKRWSAPTLARPRGHFSTGRLYLRVATAHSQAGVLAVGHVVEENAAGVLVGVSGVVLVPALVVAGATQCLLPLVDVEEVVE